MVLTPQQIAERTPHAIELYQPLLEEWNDGMKTFLKENCVTEPLMAEWYRLVDKKRVTVGDHSYEKRVPRPGSMLEETYQHAISLTNVTERKLREALTPVYEEYFHIDGTQLPLSLGLWHAFHNITGHAQFPPSHLTFFGDEGMHYVNLMKPKGVESYVDVNHPNLLQRMRSAITGNPVQRHVVTPISSYS